MLLAFSLPPPLPPRTLAGSGPSTRSRQVAAGASLTRIKMQGTGRFVRATCLRGGRRKSTAIGTSTSAHQLASHVARRFHFGRPCLRAPLHTEAPALGPEHVKRRFHSLPLPEHRILIATSLHTGLGTRHSGMLGASTLCRAMLRCALAWAPGRGVGWAPAFTDALRSDLPGAACVTTVGT